MIDELQVSNLALIKEATLIPARGLTVLTGETGAGKTALLSAMKLLIGERVDKTLVRDGADEMTVSGRLLACPARGAEADDEGDDTEETVVIRRVGADGRSRVTIDGHMASVSELTETIAGRIDLCSQNENQQLIKPATHAGMLDAWIGAPAITAGCAYKEALSAAREAEAQLRRVREATTAGQARLDDARFVLRRIDEVNPREGEYEELQQTLRVAEYAESLVAAATNAYSELAEEDGASDKLSRAIAQLESAAQHDAKLSAIAGPLRDAEALMEDSARALQRYRDSVDFDAQTLADNQERFFALQGILRTYGPRMSDVFAARAAAADLVSMVDDADLRLAEATRAYAAAQERLCAAVEALHRVRTEAAPQFGVLVTAQMARLEMGGAVLECHIEPLPEEKYSAVGPDAVEFMFRAGTGLAPRPLAKIASGGEMSRVMLALKVVLGEKDNVETLVFDEIDAGVGGATALALAEVLADLAKTHQVIVVTHLAQVAVKGDVHYKVVKEVPGAQALQGEAQEQDNSAQGHVPQTHLEKLNAEEREREIARMLGGVVSDASLAHARELLK